MPPRPMQGVMFNWVTLPTFAAMLLFWMLASYVLTRSPRSAISMTAVGAQVATAAYLLGQGMQANAATIDEWLPWVRNLSWGSSIAPVLWYWLTTLLLGEQDAPAMRPYLRRLAQPFGILLALASCALTIAIYADDALFRWNEARPLPPGQVTYSQMDLPQGPLYPGLVAFLAATTLGGAVNAVLAWRSESNPGRRRRFTWLIGSAVLFVVGANSLGVVNWLTHGAIPSWAGHLALAAAMVVMAWNVAAYSLLVRGQVIRTDFFYFHTTMVAVCLIYGLLVGLAGPGYSFQLLGLVAVTMTVAILSHALVDIARRGFDALFYTSDVRRLRSNLSNVVQEAGLNADLDEVLDTAQAEITEVSNERLVRLTEVALRRLNNPSALAGCELLARLPATVGEAYAASNGTASSPPTDLDRARALRGVLVAAIEKLKPPEAESRRDSPAALQHMILREEYLDGLLNKQIMARHAISEGTFHRNRRQAIHSVARELQAREEQFTSAGSRTF